MLIDACTELVLSILQRMSLITKYIRSIGSLKRLITVYLKVSASVFILRFELTSELTVNSNVTFVSYVAGQSQHMFICAVFCLFFI